MITSCIHRIIEKLIVAQLVEKFSAIGIIINKVQCNSNKGKWNKSSFYFLSIVVVMTIGFSTHRRRYILINIEAYRVVRSWGSHTVLKIGTQMALRLSALHTGHTLLPGNIICLLLVFISVRCWVNSKAIAQLEGLAKLKQIIHLIGVWTCDLPACSLVLQPLWYRMPLK
jgi:hypothetical protein